ncbi:helix-turn-helix transcriptional regulator [Plantibacter cousiniae (nom. nud.)]|uniref:Predicted DNA-binding transcriptional regulator YafY, contains an HTH and WYL domains n=1 Tax=Plantibacter cousiniae (nom. nud.) TaxID=199709 RepID=A0ABY1LH91_9MICO|nr:WYL domain-containing protein [Plantibacter cousiniae]SKC40513.1 Predicted DNA-binding transcriptional regulator YafY, contains an HTH and WYL domains [Plantibacter cousiniae]
MRADRLIQVLLMLQSRPQVTAAEVAAGLEVSIPTARRDLEALSSAGIPVYPVRGRNGGWRLLDGAKTNLTGLTEPEVTALFALLGNNEALPPPAATRAIAKLVRSVPSTFRSGAERVATATIRSAAWGRLEPGETPDSITVLHHAIAAQRRISFTYRDGAPREVVPLVVASKGGIWYLVGARVLEGKDTADPASLRLFRVDRIGDAEVTADRGYVFEGFDAAAVWDAMADHVEGLRGSVQAELLVNATAVQPLLKAFGIHAAVTGEQPDGRSLITVHAHTVTGLAEQLAGWTSAAQVLNPTEVRKALAAIGQRLADTYRE